MAVNTTAVWRVGPSGSNTNGGGYDPGISGAATDYSQQNAAQASGTHGTTTGTTTFVDATANAFTSAMIGNAIFITGTGQTTGFYFVTAFTNASTVTLDRSPGTGTLATWNLGGRWADFFTNTTATGPLVQGNIVYILGTATPNPASYSYDYTLNAQFTPVVGGTTGGRISFLNDPSTPGYKAPPDTTGGMPCIKVTHAAASSGAILCNGHTFSGLWFVGTTMTTGDWIFDNSNSANPAYVLFGCVGDQFGNDIFIMGNLSGAGIGTEIFSSVSAAAGTKAAIFLSSSSKESILQGCNIHDVVGIGVHSVGCHLVISNSIIAKCGSDGVLVDSSGNSIWIVNNTIDGNGGHGINYASSDNSLEGSGFLNNIISNHTAVGKFGVDVSSGSAAVNSSLPKIFDYNVYYNNTTDLNGINYGAHDTHGGSNPYVGQSTENYALA